MFPTIPVQILSSNRLDIFSNGKRTIPFPEMTVVDAEYAPIILHNESSSALHPEGKNILYRCAILV